MSPDLPEKLLGISIDGPSGRRQRTEDRDAEDEELEQFVFFSIGDQRLAVSVEDVKTITDVPEQITRVPRGPKAIEGIVDLRGEITALVEPRIHFPVEAEPPAIQRLLVFDRPTDQQPAAIRVDEVHGVEAVPASNVVDETDLDGDDADSALEHPLISALVRQERTVGPRRDRPTGGGRSEPGPASAEVSGSEAGSPFSGSSLEQRSTSSIQMDVDGEQPEIDGLEPQPSLAAARTQTGREDFSGSASETAEAEEPAAADREARTTITDVTALIDVDKLLLASGQID